MENFPTPAPIKIEDNPDTQVSMESSVDIDRSKITELASEALDKSNSMYRGAASLIEDHPELQTPEAKALFKEKMQEHLEEEKEINNRKKKFWKKFFPDYDPVHGATGVYSTLLTLPVAIVPALAYITDTLSHLPYNSGLGYAGSVLLAAVIGGAAGGLVDYNLDKANKKQVLNNINTKSIENL